MATGSTLATIALAVVGAGAVADVLIHPNGTMAAGHAANEITVPAENTILGVAPSYGGAPSFIKGG